MVVHDNSTVWCDDSPDDQHKRDLRLTGPGATEVEGRAAGDAFNQPRRPRVVGLPAPTPVEEVGPRGEPVVIAVPSGSRHAQRYARRGKRIFDVVVAVTAIVIAFPVLAAAAALVRLTMGGPVLFRQVRLGQDGQPFEVLKFRTMKPDRRALVMERASYVGEDRRKTHKSADHPLLTPAGRFLRTYSLDELPQLFNVLRGEMSVVGPRPELPSVVAGYEPWQYGRLLVRPGLTGLWQITARGSEPMHLRTDLDIDYLVAMSLRTDLRIVAATPAAMFGTQRGY